MGLVLSFAQHNSIVEPWGGNPVRRDKQLAKIWKDEPYLASAITSIAMTRSALSWELSGTPKTVQQVQNLLNRANFGQGWQHLMMQINIDLLTTDNGAFIEVIRRPPTTGRRPESMPVEGIAHLPALQCVRTGNPLEPVIYVDDDGEEHILKWYQVVAIVENPVPESTVGRQFCFVSRVLKFAQIIKDVLQYYEEKVSGRFTRSVHIVSGVAQGELEEVTTKANYDADNAGLLRYMQPIILTTLDPNATISKQTIELAALPDGFDLSTLLNWYITLLALASGSDYQEFAPLSNGNLGTASQSDTLHRKAQRKGTQLFIKIIENGLEQSKIIPTSVAFRFKQQDAQAELEQAEIEKVRAGTRQIQIADGEITPEIARQIAVDKGDLKQEYLLALGDEDLTPAVTVSDDENVSEELIAAEGKAVPLAAAQAAATHFIDTLMGHPLQAISPIGDTKLATFKAALRNAIGAGIIGTDDVWMSQPLVAAANEAGIPPQMLRARLPNNYQVLVHPGVVQTGTKQLWVAPTRPTAIVENKLAGFSDDFAAQTSDKERLGVMYRYARKVCNDKGKVENMLKACQLLLHTTNDPALFKLKLTGLLIES